MLKMASKTAVCDKEFTRSAQSINASTKRAQGPDEHKGSTQALKNKSKNKLVLRHAEESNTKTKPIPIAKSTVTFSAGRQR